MLKKIIALALLFTFCIHHSFAQQDSIAIKYAATITQADLSKHLHIIASDEYGGRETGKKVLPKPLLILAIFIKKLVSLLLKTSIIIKPTRWGYKKLRVFQ